MDAREERYLAVKDALVANWRLQKRLKETLESLEKGINANADEQAKVQATALKVNRSGWYSGLQVVGFPSVGKVGPKAIGPSRFWMAAGTVPRPNEDTLKLYPAFTYLPHTFSTRKWTPEEDEDLKQQVLTFVKNAAIEKRIEQGIQEGDAGTGGLEDQTEEIDAMTMETPGAVEEALAFPPATWDNIASSLGNTRSGMDCLLRWKNCLKPGLKQGAGEEAAPWSQEEDARLQEAAQEHGHRNWEQVAEDLGGGRSPLECLARSQYLAKLKGGPKPWTAQEIEVLKDSYARHANRASFWKTVAADLPGRTHDQVMHFHRNHVDTNVKKGRWSADEDDQLRAAVIVFGKQWSKVAEAVPRRSAMQVRERWVNMLDPAVRRDKPWTQEEDATLIKAVGECRNEDGSTRWAEVATRLPGRTDDQVSNRATSIRKFQLKEGNKKETRGRKRRQPSGPPAEASEPKRQKEGAESEAEETVSASAGEWEPAAGGPASSVAANRRRRGGRVPGKAGRGKKAPPAGRTDDSDPDISADDAPAKAAAPAKRPGKRQPAAAPKRRGRPPKGG